MSDYYRRFMDEFKTYGTYSNAQPLPDLPARVPTMAEIIDTMKSVKAQLIAPNCTACGTFAGCVCTKSERAPASCYLCSKIAPLENCKPTWPMRSVLVCPACAKRYL